jgi:hypothetical protein
MPKDLAHIIRGDASFVEPRSCFVPVLAGLQRAKAQGKRLGRPKAVAPLERLQRVRELPVDIAAERLGVSRSTIKRWRRLVSRPA